MPEAVKPAAGAEVPAVGAAVRRHYDRYSYDFETDVHASMQLDGTLLGRALDGLPPRAIVVDAGCGTGLVTRLVRAHLPQAKLAGVDLSLGSLRRARAKSPVPVAQGNILRLPARSGVADLVISRGVIMTTGAPRRAFAELVRVARPGGRVFVRVYNARHPYRWIYPVAKPVCRAIAALPGGKTLLALTVVPLFLLVTEVGFLLLTGRFTRIPPRVGWNFFADQLLTPHNSFHTAEEVIAWGREEGLRCVAHQAITLGQQIEFVFEKDGR